MAMASAWTVSHVSSGFDEIQAPAGARRFSLLRAHSVAGLHDAEGEVVRLRRVWREGFALELGTAASKVVVLRHYPWSLPQRRACVGWPACHDVAWRQCETCLRGRQVACSSRPHTPLRPYEEPGVSHPTSVIPLVRLIGGPLLLPTFGRSTGSVARGPQCGKFLGAPRVDRPPCFAVEPGPPADVRGCAWQIWTQWPAMPFAMVCVDIGDNWVANRFRCYRHRALREVRTCHAQLLTAVARLV